MAARAATAVAESGTRSRDPENPEGGCSDKTTTVEAARHRPARHTAPGSGTEQLGPSRDPSDLPARRTTPGSSNTQQRHDGPTPRGAVERDSLVERTAQQLRRIARKPLRQRDARSAIAVEATIRKLQKSVDAERAQLQRMTAKNSRDQSMATLLREQAKAREQLQQQHDREWGAFAERLVSSVESRVRADAFDDFIRGSDLPADCWSANSSLMGQLTGPPRGTRDGQTHTSQLTEEALGYLQETTQWWEREQVAA